MGHSPSNLRRFSIFIVSVTIIQAVLALLLASHKPMSADELTTLAVAQQRSWSAIWNADFNKADGMPPLYHYIHGIFLRLPLRPEIALRLPSILGFSLLIPSLFAFVGRVSGWRSGFVAACFPLATGAYFFSYEARTYALTLGLTAVALFLWQQAHTRPHRVKYSAILALALGAAAAVNYNALYGFFPFFLAEAVSAIRKRQIHWTGFFALLAGLVPYGIYWPIMSRLQKYYGAGFWAKPSLGLIVETVHSWANPDTALSVFLFTTIGMAVLLLFRKPDVQPETSSRPASPEEWSVCIGFCAVPAVVFVVASILRGGMVARYSITFIIGASLLVGYATRFLRTAFLNVIAVCLLAAFFIVAIQQLHKSTSPEEAAWRQHSDLKEYVTGDRPIVISDGLTYVQLAYYSSPKVRSRLYYIDDPAQALRYLHTDTVDLSIPILARYLPLQVMSFKDFTEHHASFLLYSGAQWDWLEPYLMDQRRCLQLMAVDHEWALYQVTSSSSSGI
jgi:4-amino-4-deoxy-L-arabinose transferase-like glycosyltransferase